MDGFFHFSLSSFSFAFLSILLEGLPFLLLGTILSGLIDQFLPVRAMTGLLPRRPVAGALVSGLLGLIFPMCECGVVPIIRRLMAKGLPPANAITYMLAAPIVNPIVLLSTYAAFRGQAPLEMTIFRLSLGYAVAVAAGIVAQRVPIDKMLRPEVLADIAIPSGQSAGTPSGKIGFRLWSALSICVSDFLNMTIYFVLGAAAAALFNTAVNQDVIIPLAENKWLATGSLMALSSTLCLCSTTDAFIAATLTMFPAVAKLAFLVFGPMMDFKLVFIYSSVFRKRFVLGLVVALFLTIILVCMRLQSVYPNQVFSP